MTLGKGLVMSKKRHRRPADNGIGRVVRNAGIAAVVKYIVDQLLTVIQAVIQS